MIMDSHNLLLPSLLICQIHDLVVTNQPHSIIGIQSIAGLIISDHDIIQDSTCYTFSKNHLHV